MPYRLVYDGFFHSNLHQIQTNTHRTPAPLLPLPLAFGAPPARAILAFLCVKNFSIRVNASWRGSETGDYHRRVCLNTYFNSTAFGKRYFAKRLSAATFHRMKQTALLKWNNCLSCRCTLCFCGEHVIVPPAASIFFASKQAASWKLTHLRDLWHFPASKWTLPSVASQSRDPWNSESEGSCCT
jgi:hypothetical protein